MNINNLEYFNVLDWAFPSCSTKRKLDEVVLPPKYDTVIEVTPEMLNQCINDSSFDIKARPTVSERFWQVANSCRSLFSCNKSQDENAGDKKSISCGGKTLRIAAAFCGTGLSTYFLTRAYSPFTHLFNMVSNKGWRALTDLDNVTLSCQTVKDVAKKYIPLGLLIGGAYFADKHVLGIIPVSQVGCTYVVLYTRAVLLIQDYNTWMGGGKSKGGE